MEKNNNDILMSKKTLLDFVKDSLYVAHIEFLTETENIPFTNPNAYAAFDFCTKTGVFENIGCPAFQLFLFWILGKSDKQVYFIKNGHMQELGAVLDKIDRTLFDLENLGMQINDLEGRLETYTDPKLKKELFGQKDLPEALTVLCDTHANTCKALLKELRQYAGRRKHKLHVLYSRFGKIIYRAYKQSLIDKLAVECPTCKYRNLSGRKQVELKGPESWPCTEACNPESAENWKPCPKILRDIMEG